MKKTSKTIAAPTAAQSETAPAPVAPAVLLNERQAAEYLGRLGISVKVRLLQHWRQTDREPNYRKINGRVFYDRAVLDRWFASTAEVL